MKRIWFILWCSLCGAAITVALAVARSPSLSFSDVSNLLGSVFFVESATPEDLQERYARALSGDRKVRVLIVPGHDEQSWGTEFRGVKEADMTAVVGEELERLLKNDPAIEPILVRTRAGYTQEFKEYFATERARVPAFLKEKKQTMQELIRAGEVHLTKGVIHNSAPNAVAEKLYSINAYANEREVDIVAHLHFNDYPGRPSRRAGRYNGFSIYVPDRQFSNARASRAVADALFEQFSRFYAESNLPVEDSGIVPDQELIALGSYNTLDPAGVLIEYGYIYEQKFLDEEVREAALHELAFQTYRGLNRFFGRYGDVFQKYPTALLPHEWRDSFGEGRTGVSVLSLQTALALEHLYPPTGESKRDCPLTGSFGPCTRRAVSAFQEKHGITPASGVVGPQTREKLNEKYSR